MMQTLTEVKVV